MTQIPLIETFYRLIDSSPSRAIESFEIILMRRKPPDPGRSAAPRDRRALRSQISIPSSRRCEHAHITRKAFALRERLWPLHLERHLPEELSDQQAARLADRCGNWFRD
jgi:hypothetical protein